MAGFLEIGSNSDGITSRAKRPRRCLASWPEGSRAFCRDGGGALLPPE